MSDPSNPYFTRVIDTNHDSKDVLALYNAGVLPLTYRVIQDTINLTTAGVYPITDLQGNNLQFQAGTHVLYAGLAISGLSVTGSTTICGLATASTTTPGTTLVSCATGATSANTAVTQYVPVTSVSCYASLVFGNVATTTGTADVTLIVS